MTLLGLKSGALHIRPIMSEAMSASLVSPASTIMLGHAHRRGLAAVKDYVSPPTACIVYTLRTYKHQKSLPMSHLIHLVDTTDQPR